jgi:hypothetical protein
MLIKKLKTFIKNLKNSEKKNESFGMSKMRMCSKCKETFPLDQNHFQVVKYFNEKYSFYCNTCNTQSRKVNS